MENAAPERTIKETVVIGIRRAGAGYGQALLLAGKESLKVESMFTVDREGLRKILARSGKSFIVRELAQNGLDEDISNLDMSFGAVEGEAADAEGRKLYRLAVEDDAPRGFANLAHAYTLFAESEKVHDPERRGRFNLGEKLVIAACERASVVSTTGTVLFGEKGRSVDNSPAACRERGSLFEGYLRLEDGEAGEVDSAARHLIKPPGRPDLRMAYNGEPLTDRSEDLVTSFEASLITENANEKGELKRTRRKTTLRIYKTRDGEPAMLYEMGIPVVESGDLYDVDIGQKIPLTVDRENVQAAYLQRVRELVLENAVEGLRESFARDPEAASGGWVNAALEGDNVSREAVDAVLDARYGSKRVVRDLSDPEGTKIAVSEGYTVIQPGSFNKKQWEAIKRTESALPAGKVTPSPKPYREQGEDSKVVPVEKYTQAMRRVVDYSGDLGRRLLEARVTVTVVNDISWPFAATYGPRGSGAGELTFNLGRLGHRFFEDGASGEADGLDEVNRLLIHEMAHHRVSDHLESAYHEECCRLGARLSRLASEDPQIFDSFRVR